MIIESLSDELVKADVCIQFNVQVDSPKERKHCRSLNELNQWLEVGLNACLTNGRYFFTIPLVEIVADITQQL